MCTYVGTLQSSSGGSCTEWVGNKWILAGELLLSPRDKGCRGAFGPCLYVKGVQKFLPVFKSDGSRGSTACDWSATGHPGASRDPLVRLDQDAEKVKAPLSMFKKSLATQPSPQVLLLAATPLHPRGLH